MGQQIFIPVDNKLVLYDENKSQLVFQNGTGIFEISPQFGGQETLYKIIRVMKNKKKKLIGLIYPDRKDKKLFAATDTRYFAKGRYPFECAAFLISKIKKLTP